MDRDGRRIGKPKGAKIPTRQYGAFQQHNDRVQHNGDTHVRSMVPQEFRHAASIRGRGAHEVFTACAEYPAAGLAVDDSCEAAENQEFSKDAAKRDWIALGIQRSGQKGLG